MNHPGWMEGLATAKKQGKARFVGFSTHANIAECLRAAVAGRFCDVVLTSFNYAMGENPDLAAEMKKAAEAGLGLIAMKTQCRQYTEEEKEFLKDSGVAAATPRDYSLGSGSSVTSPRPSPFS
jgi:predicted aldo/keto reductase-like oxidoreductase